MEDRKVLRRKSAGLIKAAICGVFFFDGLYVLLSRMTSREGPDVAALLLAIVPEAVRRITGWNDPPATVESGRDFDLIVLGLFGAVIFIAGALMFRLLVRAIGAKQVG